MIPNLKPLAQACWKRELAAAFRQPAHLLAALGLEGRQTALADRGQQQFPLLVPRGFAARMRHGDPNDPLLRQVLPLAEEDISAPGFLADPVGDGQAQAAPGVLHKYHGRVLLIATGGCAINCRYCFRRHFPYAEARAGTRRWQAELEYLRCHPEVSEVILSGGDPLLLDTPALQALSSELEKLEHIKRLRIHSNHIQETDASVARALAKLRQAGVTLLNQAVLLAGINDSLEAQCDLAEGLFEHGVLPYYLHQLDRVQGAAHFAVSDEQAIDLYQQMRERLPGYLLPRLVREIEGENSKTAL